MCSLAFSFKPGFPPVVRLITSVMYVLPLKPLLNSHFSFVCFFQVIGPGKNDSCKRKPTTNSLQMVGSSPEQHPAASNMIVMNFADMEPNLLTRYVHKLRSVRQSAVKLFDGIIHF